MPPISNGNIYLKPLIIGEAGKVQQDDQLKAMIEEVYNMIVNKDKQYNPYCFRVLKQKWQMCTIVDS